jgi:hypothetical protein
MMKRESRVPRFEVEEWKEQDAKGRVLDWLSCPAR